jgi:hypothetical protein
LLISVVNDYYQDHDFVAFEEHDIITPPSAAPKKGDTKTVNDTIVANIPTPIKVITIYVNNLAL